MRLQHAEHNEEICAKIDALTGFDDWVVTTAFYACIHFVEHRLFPLTEQGITYPTFNKYYNDTVLSKSRNLSKHNLKLQLVNSYIPKVYPNYKRLMDNCLTARYKNYRIGKILSQIAITDMSSIKAECI
jgi:hypothetical protein